MQNLLKTRFSTRIEIYNIGAAMMKKLARGVGIVFLAMGLPSEASSNTAYGTGALYYNTSGAYNSAFGFAALYSNTTGSNNTATG
jgi:hypothetical protein